MLLFFGFGLLSLEGIFYKNRDFVFFVPCPVSMPGGVGSQCRRFSVDIYGMKEQENDCLKFRFFSKVWAIKENELVGEQNPACLRRMDSGIIYQVGMLMSTRSGLNQKDI